MGKVDRLELNLLLPCSVLWTLYLSTPDPARRPGVTPPPNIKHVLICCFNSQQIRVAPPPLSYRGMLFIYAYTALTADNDYNVDMMRSPSCVQKNNFIIIIIISAAAFVSEFRGGCPSGWVYSTGDAIIL